MMKLNSSWVKQAGQSAAVILILLAVTGCPSAVDTNPTARTVADLPGVVGASFITPEISAADRDYLLSIYKDTWNYMADFVEPMTGLPYDSNKKQPATSVSNIGLYLASTAIAYRTKLISKDEALSRINDAFTSLEKLETWRGFPRVWIAVRSLKPIRGGETFAYSKHIANLVGGLMLAQIVFPEELSQQIESYFRGLQFKGMYDSRTGWLKGGYDLKLQNFSVAQPFGPWHYKFLASESRLISYYLIARGFAPTSHWTSLVRTIQNEDSGDWFLVSGIEDGGAFMPYMAGLYVDERDMLMGLSQRNYTHASMKHAEKIGAPVWGWSASLDTRGEYISYGQLKDEIVAPYASILAVNYFPNEVVANLKMLEKIGARPAAEAKNITEILSAFTDERSAFVAPYAFIHNKTVFLVDSKGLVSPLKDYLDPSFVEQSVNLQSGREPRASNKTVILKLETDESQREILRSAQDDKILLDTLDLFFKVLNEPVYQGKSAHELVQSASRGTGVRETLEKRVGGPEQLRAVLALAAKVGEYQFGEIRLKDGTVLKTVWSQREGVTIPKVIAYKTDIYFFNDFGVYEPLSGFLDNADTDLSITGYDRNRVAFVAALTGQAGALNDGAAVLKRGTRFFDALKSKTGLSSTIAAEIAALASVIGDYQPAKLQWDNGTGLELALGLPGTRQPFMQTPWALADSKEVVFISPRQDTLENVSSYLDQSQINQPVQNLDRRTLVVFAEDLGFKPETGKNAQDYFKQAVYGTLIKPALRKEVADEILRQSLLGLTAKAGLYTPAKVELEDGSTALILLADSGDKMTVVATAKDGKVFFLGSDRQAHLLKDFEKEPAGGVLVSAYERCPLDVLAAALGYELHTGEWLEDQVQSVTLGTLQSASLVESVADAVILPELEALASFADSIQPGQVKISGKTPLWIALSDSRSHWVPYATVSDGGSDVSFLNQEGLRRNLSSYLDNTMLGMKSQAYDRGVLTELLVKAGVLVKGLAPEATLGTLVKNELLSQVGDPQILRELLGLAGKAGLYKPGSVTLKDVGLIPVLFTKEGDLYRPWAMAYGETIYFKNKQNTIESLSAVKTKEPASAVASGSDPQIVAFITGKDSKGVAPSFFYQASQQSQLSQAFVDSFDSTTNSAELLGLAASIGTYDPVHVKLTETKMKNYGFRDSVDWKSGKVTPYYLTPSQGMAFLSLANFLYDGVVWKAFSENVKMKNALDKLREIDRTQNLLGDQAQRGCMLFPKTQTRAA